MSRLTPLLGKEFELGAIKRSKLWDVVITVLNFMGTKRWQTAGDKLTLAKMLSGNNTVNYFSVGLTLTRSRLDAFGGEMVLLRRFLFTAGIMFCHFMQR